MVNSSRFFYETLGYQIPQQREFFTYMPMSEDEKMSWSSPLIRWQWVLEDSFEQHDVWPWIERFAQWFRYIPFVQAVFVSGDVTFGVDTKSREIVVVANTKRVRIVKTWLYCLTKLINIWSQHRSLPTREIVMVLDRNAIGLHRMRKGVWDIMSVYRLAHWCLIYQQYPRSDAMVYDANTWIRYYLPSHPLQSCIYVWNMIQEWTSAIRRWVERVFSGWLGLVVERCACRLGVYLSTESDRVDSQSWSTASVWGNVLSRRRIGIQRKIYQKQLAEGADS